MNRDTVIQQLTVDEGQRLKLYVDTQGKTTIGVGRNLTDVGINAIECDLMLNNDIDSACQFLDKHLPWWTQLDDNRQDVLVNMAFNMRDKLLGFTNMLSALQAGDWRKAHDEMLNSVWAREVGARAERLATIVLGA